MTQAEKLEALMRRASDGGYDGPSHADYMHFDSIGLFSILFNHDFARALFGDFPTYVTQGFERYNVGKDVKSWLGPAKEAIKDESFVTGALTYRAFEYRTMQAVISDDPIDYMYKAVFGE